MELFKLFGTILIDNSKANQSLHKTDQTAQSTGANMVSAFKKIGGALVTYFSVKQLISFGNACIEAYNVQAEAETKLEEIMKQRFNSTEQGIQSIKNYASELQNLGVVGDEVQLSGAQQLATFLQTEDALKTLMPAMADLAVQQNGVNVTSENMVSIGNMMGKAMQGQTSALTRVGITMTEAQEQVMKFGTEEERASMLAEIITDNVGHMNEVMAQTDAGKIQQAKNAMGDLKEEIGARLIPIQAVFYSNFANLCTLLGNTLCSVIDTLNVAFTNLNTFMTEHETLVQVLAIAIGTLTTAFVAYNIAQNASTIIIGLYCAVTDLATLATTAFSTALTILTSPISLVIIAIGALIAIGVVLYKNWDEISKWAQETWQKIKDSIVGFVEDTKQNVIQKWEEVKNSVKQKWDDLKNWALNIWQGIKQNVINPVLEAKQNVENKIEEMKNNIINKWNEAKKNATDTFNAIKDAIMNPVETAKRLVGEAVETIKSKFRFSWSLPRPSLPHFSVSGGKAPWGFMGKGSLPSVSISWYKKAEDEPYLLDGATLFGRSGNKLLGGGERKPEIIYGHDSLMNDIREASWNKNLDDILGKIYALLLVMSKNMNTQIVLDNGTLVGALLNDIDSGLGNITSMKLRGVK